MIQYYSEKRGGIYHSFAKVGAPKQHQEESWSFKKFISFGYYAPIWITLGAIGAALYIYRETITKWWNGPMDEEEFGDLG
jgi:hypothetical protein